MAGVNKVILVGNLGKDPETKSFANGMVAKFPIATSETYKDKNGNKVEQTEWHNVEVWGELAKIAEQYLRKGKKVYLEGSLRTDSWEDNGVKKYATKIRVTTFQMLDSAQGGNSGGENQEQSASAPSSPTYTKAETTVPKEIVASETDDLPF